MSPLDEEWRDFVLPFGGRPVGNLGRPSVGVLKARVRPGNRQDSATLVRRRRPPVLGPQGRRDNNLRALDSFLASAHSKRRLVPISNRRYRATIDNVIISLSADMQPTESGELRISIVEPYQWTRKPLPSSRNWRTGCLRRMPLRFLPINLR
jgi:hypothetical protein